MRLLAFCLLEHVFAGKWPLALAAAKPQSSSAKAIVNLSQNKQEKPQTQDLRRQLRQFWFSAKDVDDFIENCPFEISTLADQARLRSSCVRFITCSSGHKSAAESGGCGEERRATYPDSSAPPPWAARVNELLGRFLGLFIACAQAAAGRCKLQAAEPRSSLRRHLEAAAATQAARSCRGC